ncbi:MSMEG_1061 family FMN-dependent PPOX-type flavoprotein [Palleronia sp. LCG004]|uniref:MSMEG_1061 family FMN-dependent PPOX-type flavoprotein n=1 Tax=Palleronia sp. LCG004 TaxID=3079304 RepID=UPI00294339B6|nr:MSMEG_1061 family FMN-dependent PPOX-type flavoprotein [Palleronia sp. LCG004]WOI55390.1 pyridoxamine 5'-phosphate oxidase family protein [Palleronia sp. LCG004]
MKTIGTIEELRARYAAPKRTSMEKVARDITPVYAAWIARSRFCVLSTVGPEGTDASPRGDDGPVVRIVDARHLLMPDWYGNNRLDSLENIVEDGRVSLMFFVPGSRNVVRVNGHGTLVVDDALLESFAHRGKPPATVLSVEVAEVYFQCARAILRSNLWSGRDESADLPSAGDMLAAMAAEAIEAREYDRAWAKEAPETLW